MIQNRIVLLGFGMQSAGTGVGNRDLGGGGVIPPYADAACVEEFVEHLDFCNGQVLNSASWLGSFLILLLM